VTEVEGAPNGASSRSLPHRGRSSRHHARKAKFVLRPCVAPDLVGETLAAAKAAIKKAFCSVGKVKTITSSRPKGVVLPQKPRHGRLKQHAKINLVVSKG
jgi:hypothetical protein